MNKQIRTDTIIGGNLTETTHLEFASALFAKNYTNINIVFPQETIKIFDLFINIIKYKNTIMYIDAMPNFIGMGDVASNFRYKHSAEINNHVVENWIKIFNEYNKYQIKNPIVVTIPARSSRLFTLKMPEDGSIQIFNNKYKYIDLEKTQIFQNFLDNFKFKKENIKKFRISSKGAHYNSYLADMIGFLNIVNWNLNRSIFKYSSLEPIKINTTMKYNSNIKSEKILTPTIINGKKWVPKNEYDYLYFKKQDKITSNTQIFAMVKENEIAFVYNQLFQAIDLKENSTKKLIRQFMCDMNSYTRNSDYWVNDIDDALQLLMILNCFKYSSLNDAENNIFQQLNTLFLEIF
jgi:hypothetical protein